ncbi:MAG: hypothetical protein HOL61_14900 [Rhodospirillaceae bacterium]|nr:hypothetical protein [Rhodospirillaceae bacterium]
MFQLDSEFSNAALDSFVAELAIHEVTDTPAANSAHANENSRDTGAERSHKDKVAWEDDEYYFVRES